ncbi:hypothetical protein ANCDUO_16050 [Ancylostoma duodenale]|uniref:Phlebovirus glycoprotein G2 fusion domain-containing protein n=1 Tax=Ancylostoma duodenale TaxID=51022 RepID=A0A0C2FYW2_9BILA|nr:hypothetical protein ANCDUO_16050 [Ancylostoma duodenale]
MSMGCKEQMAQWSNLNIHKDSQGIMRCYGRIKTKNMAPETQEPILLPPHHPLTPLFVMETHVRCGHQGVNGTLANIRLHFWIPKGRQVVKKCLNKCLICKRWNEIEAMVNSRPLTYAGSTLEDSVVLRPIDFLTHRANVNLFPQKESEKEDQEPEYLPTISTREQAAQYLEKQQQYLQELWKVWKGNYLLELRNFHQKRIKQKKFTRKQLFPGEVVLLTDENAPRGDWQLGLILELIKDPDGEVRSVKLRTKQSTLERSINMLTPLEISKSGNDMNERYEENTGNNESNEKIEEKETHQKETDRPHASSEGTTRTVIRQRPFLPRRAKERTTMTTSVFTDTNTATTGRGSCAFWHHWLAATIIATLCSGAHTKNDQQPQLRCVKGGIGIALPHLYNEIEVCGNEQCFEIKQPDLNFTVQFPAEVTLHNYHVTVKLMERNTTRSTHWACPPSPFCEQIACNFCSAMVSNPECWPRLAIGITAVLLYVMLITILVIILLIRKIVRGLAKLFRNMSFVGNLLTCLLRPFRNREYETESIPLLQISNHRRNRWNASTIIRVLTVVILTCTTAVLGCQQTIIIPSSISQCTNKNTGCINHRTVIAKLNPMQPELCLTLNQGNRTQLALKVTLEEVILRCQRETLYFTRNTEVKVQYRKRCPHMGTCTGMKCGKIKPESLIAELDVANNFTGITYCTESCGGLGCSCGFPSSGCLFYRIYHSPLDEKIFEVFQCPSWHETVKINYQEFKGNIKTNSYRVEIPPRSVKPLGKSTLEITTLSFNPISILTKRFITDGTASAYLHDETAFSYACEARPDTGSNSTSHCTIKDTCKCTPAEDLVNCYCQNNNVTNIMRLSNTLPLPISNGIVRTEGRNQVPTVRSKATSVELAVVFDPQITEMKQEIVEFTCNIVPLSFVGCYNCMQGAIASIICYSDVPKTTAQVTCSTQEFTLMCSPPGKLNQVKLFFNTAAVIEQYMSGQMPQPDLDQAGPDDNNEWEEESNQGNGNGNAEQQEVRLNQEQFQQLLDRIEEIKRELNRTTADTQRQIARLEAREAYHTVSWTLSSI